MSRREREIQLIKRKKDIFIVTPTLDQSEVDVSRIEKTEKGEAEEIWYFFISFVDLFVLGFSIALVSWLGFCFSTAVLMPYIWRGKEIDKTTIYILTLRLFLFFSFISKSPPGNILYEDDGTFFMHLMKS